MKYSIYWLFVKVITSYERDIKKESEERVKGSCKYIGPFFPSAENREKGLTAEVPDFQTQVAVSMSLDQNLKITDVNQPGKIIRLGESHLNGLAVGFLSLFRQLLKQTTMPQVESRQ